MMRKSLNNSGKKGEKRKRVTKKIGRSKREDGGTSLNTRKVKRAALSSRGPRERGQENVSKKTRVRGKKKNQNGTLSSECRTKVTPVETAAKRKSILAPVFHEEGGKKNGSAVLCWRELSYLAIYTLCCPITLYSSHPLLICPRLARHAQTVLGGEWGHKRLLAPIRKS